MIYEFWQYEKHHGKRAKDFDIVFNGERRDFLLANNPKAQRISHCQGCGTKVPREVPRVKLEASYYYGAGYYCLSCGIKKLIYRREHLERAKSKIGTEISKLQELEQVAKEIMNDEWYPKKMALAKMLQVMENEGKNRRY